MDLVEKYSNISADSSGADDIVDKYSNLGATNEDKSTQQESTQPVEQVDNNIINDTSPDDLASGGQTPFTDANGNPIVLGDATYQQPTDVPQGDNPYHSLTEIPNYQSQQEVEQERTLSDKFGGVAEAGLAVGSGATSGLLARIASTVKNLNDGLGRVLTGGEFDADQIQKNVEATQQQFTYSPKGEAGQEYLQKTGEVLKPLESINPAQGVLLGQAARNAATVAKAGKAPNVPEPKVDDIDIGQQARLAASGDNTAKQTIIDAADLDKKAIDSASNLDIDLSVDLFSQNEYIKQLAGQVRGKVAGEESVKFAESIQAAVTKADDALESLGGTPDIANISNRVKTQLNDNISGLKSEASKLYDQIDGVIPKESEVNASNINSLLKERSKELGGDKFLSSQEKKLLSSLDGMTYGRLLDLKSDVGSALGSQLSQSKFSNVTEGTLKRLYGAISKDQMDVAKVNNLDGDLKLANQLTAKRKGLEKRVVDTFGKDGEGSIAQTIKTSITQASKGDDKNLNRVLKAVPKELRKEALATALSSLSQTNRANQQGFNFSSYNKTYRGLRQNPSIYKKIVDEMGDGSHEVLRDLFHVSRVVSDATSRVPKTGASNQILHKATAENILVKIVDRTAGIADVVSNRATLGVSGDNIFRSIISAGRTDKTQALAALFRDDSFKQMMRSSAKNGITAKHLNGLKKSSAFKRWTKSIGESTLQPETLLILANQKEDK